MKKSILTEEVGGNLLYYHDQTGSSEMMVKAKGLEIGISTLYYWIYHGKLGVTKQDLLYPRKGKVAKKQGHPKL